MTILICQNNRKNNKDDYNTHTNYVPCLNYFILHIPDLITYLVK